VPRAGYQPFYSLANARKAGTLLLTKRSLGNVPVHCSIDSAIAAIRAQAEADALAAPNAATACLSSQAPPHDPEGRFQFARFQGLDLLHTYVPNRGYKAESIQQRRQWDDQMLAFLRRRAELAPHTPLVWCGDLNVAHTPDDSTDDAFFRSR
jgi:exonuclease III